MSEAERSSEQALSAVFKLGLDPQLVFKVEEVVFGLPQSQLMSSEFFRDMLSSAHIGSPNEGTIENPIVLESMTLAQVTSLCRVLNCRCFEPKPDLSASEWSEALYLATAWGFKAIRSYAIQALDSMTLDPLESITIAERCGVAKWLQPAYLKLCLREGPLTAEEGERLGIRRYAALVRVREMELREQLKTAEGKSNQNSGGCQGECCQPKPPDRSTVLLSLISEAPELGGIEEST
ncbi:hypothetical protein FRB90_006647 [Tulasnella sp. 427]|nr:hypothetical protein FRB90_006647 [Tulasnella sp. 427]